MSSHQGNWADIVDEDSNELSFLKRPPTFADGKLTSQFDPLLDASSKDGLNALFSRGMTSMLDASNSSNHGVSAKAPMTSQPRPAPRFASIAKSSTLPAGSPQNGSAWVAPPVTVPPPPTTVEAPPAPVPAASPWGRPPAQASSKTWGQAIPTKPLLPDLIHEYLASEEPEEQIPPPHAADRDASPERDKSPEQASIPKEDKEAEKRRIAPKSKGKGRQKGKETDPHRLDQRLKQVQFGKNTKGYAAYCQAILRDARANKDPQTPEYDQLCSKRSWDGQVSKWRRLLHVYDPPTAEQNATDSLIEQMQTDS